MQTFYFVIGLLINVASGAVFIWLLRYMPKKCHFICYLLLLITTLGSGFAVSMCGPIRKALTLRQVEFLSSSKLVSTLAEGHSLNPQSKTVMLDIENGKGEYMTLVIHRATKKVWFTGVKVPEEVKVY